MSRQSNSRISTGLVLLAIAIGGALLLPPRLFFLVYLAFFTLGTEELVRILRFWAPHAPLRLLLIAVPAVAGILAGVTERRFDGPAVLLVVATGGVVVLGAALAVLWSRTPAQEAVVAIGFFTFVLPYVAVPAVSYYHLHRIDPWLLVVAAMLVASGDTAAYFVGSRIGRHQLAPRVSPKKTWEGTIAGWLAAMLLVAGWSFLRFEAVDPAWLLLAAVTAVVGQLGDLVESLVKRGAGIKDSSHLLPGHGGIYDRIDAHLLAAPVFVVGFWILGLERHYPNLTGGHP